MLHAVRAMPSRATAALACLVLVASAAVSVVLGRGLSTWQQAVGGSAHQVVAGLRSAAAGTSITVPTAPAQPPAPTATTGHAQHVTPTVSATHTQRVATGTASAAAHHSGPRSTASHQQQRSGGGHDGSLVKQVQNTAARSTGLRSVDVGKTAGDLTHGLLDTTSTLTKGALGLLGVRATPQHHSAPPARHSAGGDGQHGHAYAYGRHDHGNSHGHGQSHSHGHGHGNSPGHGHSHGHGHGHGHHHGHGHGHHHRHGRG